MSNNDKSLIEFLIEIDRIPLVTSETIIKDVIDKMGLMKLGIACLADSNKVLKGVVTDGDIRRNLVNIQKPFSAFFSDNIEIIANKNPITLPKDSTVENGIKTMIDNSVWDLPIVEKDNTLIGLVHFHNLVKLII